MATSYLLEKALIEFPFGTHTDELPGDFKKARGIIS
jgi:hypothetical protein